MRTDPRATPPGAPPRYVIVSPVKDEERHVELTLRSVTEQTLPPALWVIVDDGSRDRTPEIVRRYAARHPFIRLVSSGHMGPRRPGSPVIRAFDRGRGTLDGTEYEFIVKLDCDLSFGRDYFEQLLQRFEDEERLGIASGIYMEMDATGTWVPVKMPAYHAFGASKVVRRECFEAIGGFPPAAGWDTVDEIRAIARGWQTRHFPELPVKHHKPEGTGIGLVETSRMHGEIFYVTGGDPIFLVFKVLHRVASRPFLLSAVALTAGYVSARLRRRPRLVTPEEAQCYRRMLRRRLVGMQPTDGLTPRALLSGR